MRTFTTIAPQVIHTNGLGDVADTSSPVDSSVMAYWAASYAGSFAGGAGVGYVVGRKGKSAVTGGLVSSGLWCMTEGFRDFSSSPLLGTGFLAAGIASIVVAWKRR